MPSPVQNEGIGFFGFQKRAGGLGQDQPSPTFKELIDRYIGRVNNMQLEAEGMLEAYATGETDNLPQVLIAVRKAELAFHTMLQIRNKLVEGFEELMRMRV